ncbi:glycosidase [Granulicella aggregans]|uniref:Glycosidase n=1 Tax=Granulicella aggregans TaxID=474949 RepID=A0A7W8E5X1_9BACT|nr:alpha-amylase family glycosyl hydrolase [Granulicella aggregans]MBB5060046.1 glycosidase [Granulicella aggregans]
MSIWAQHSSQYHLYPLGCLNAPQRNTFLDRPADRVSQLYPWLDYLQDLGTDTLLIGPVQQSSAHGYDIADYFLIDGRLGSNQDFADFSRELHGRGMKLVFDAVFHHTGRDFWAFRDILGHGQSSVYRDWYHLDFSGRSPYGDLFSYEGWAGHYDLVKLNLRNTGVKDHLFAAVTSWVDQFDVDGLRLDAADRLDPDFRRHLVSHCATLKPGFWLMGEVVHGDYGNWAHDGGLSSTTNYEVYKSLWSAHNDRNYFELGYSLNRQFGEGGLYRDLNLYSFADNHDVDRVASTLSNPAHLYPLYLLLFTMPGIPSLYYGSEWGIEGRRSSNSDAALRPAVSPASLKENARHADLYPVIKHLLSIRRQQSALREGKYTSLHIDHEQLAFIRGSGTGSLVVAVNSSNTARDITLTLPGVKDGYLTDLLNGGEIVQVTNGLCTLSLASCWGRILTLSC